MKKPSVCCIVPRTGAFVTLGDRVLLRPAFFFWSFHRMGGSHLSHNFQVCVVVFEQSSEYKCQCVTATVTVFESTFTVIS